MQRKSRFPEPVFFGYLIPETVEINLLFKKWLVVCMMTDFTLMEIQLGSYFFG